MMTNEFSSDLELIHIRETDLDLELTNFTPTSTLNMGHDGPWDTDTAPLATGICSTGNGERATPQYIGGTALFTLIVGLTMAAFLLMIDSTILVTVSYSEIFNASTQMTRPFPQLPTPSTLWMT